MAKGIVYCLTNPAMPGLVKIGCVKEGVTIDDLNRRLGELYNTSVPEAFAASYAVIVEDAKAAEKTLHDTFADRRPNSRREFFKIAPSRVESAMRLMLTQGGEELSTDILPQTDADHTPITEEEAEEENDRVANYNFAKFGVPNGAELEYRDDPTVKAVVLSSSNKIRFDKRDTTPSGAAGKVRKSRSEATPVNGYKFWIYRDDTLPEEQRGETLFQRRIRIEAEQRETEE